MRTLFLKICTLLLLLSTSLQGGVLSAAPSQNSSYQYCPECNQFPCFCTDSSIPSAQNPQTNQATSAKVPKKPKCETKPKAKPICATTCGISLWWFGLGIAAMATTASFLIKSNNGISPTR